MRLLMGAPLAVLGLWAVASGHVSPGHEELVAQTATIRAGGFSLSDIGSAYPPAPVLLSLIVGGAAGGLTVLSSMMAGGALHAAWERMVQKEVPFVTQLTMVLAVTAIPSVWFLASQNIAAVGGLMMLVIALAGFIRFVFEGDTVGGFTAGLFIAIAFLFDPAAMAYAISLALAVPLLASAWYSREVAATRALVSVLCFPVVAVLLGWAFLEWRFDGSAFSFITSDLDLFNFEVSWLTDLGAAAVAVLRDVAFVPVYLAVAILLVSQRPIAGVGYLIPIAGLILARWSGLSYSSTTALVLLTLLAMVSLPGRQSRMARWLIPLAAVVQLGLNIAYPPNAPGFDAWATLF